MSDERVAILERRLAEALERVEAYDHRDAYSYACYSIEFTLFNLRGHFDRRESKHPIDPAWALERVQEALKRINDARLETGSPLAIRRKPEDGQR